MACICAHQGSCTPSLLHPPGAAEGAVLGRGSGAGTRQRLGRDGSGMPWEPIAVQTLCIWVHLRICKVACPAAGVAFVERGARAARLAAAGWHLGCLLGPQLSIVPAPCRFPRCLRLVPRLLAPPRHSAQTARLHPLRHTAAPSPSASTSCPAHQSSPPPCAWAPLAACGRPRGAPGPPGRRQDVPTA